MRYLLFALVLFSRLASSALVLDGVDQGATSATPVDFLTFPCSVAIWYKPDAAPVSSTEFMYELGPDDGVEHMGGSVRSGTAVSRQNYTNAFSQNLEPTTLYTTGWNLLVFSMPAADSKTVTINGDTANKASTGTSNLAFAVEMITLGSLGPIGSEASFFAGKLAHFITWDGVALDDADVTSLWNSGNGVVPNTIESAKVSTYAPLISNGTATTGQNFTPTNSPTFDSDDPIVSSATALPRRRRL